MIKETIYTDSLGLEWSREDLEAIGGAEALEDSYKKSVIRLKKKEDFLKLSSQVHSSNPLKSLAVFQKHLLKENPEENTS